MEKFIAVALVLLCSSCKVAPFRVAADTCYDASDATRYNSLLLRLSPAGSYDARIQGDIGIWGSSKGNWTMASPQEIQFTTSSQTGEVFLRRAKVTRDGSLEAQPIPVEPDDLDSRLV